VADTAAYKYAERTDGGRFPTKDAYQEDKVEKLRDGRVGRTAERSRALPRVLPYAILLAIAAVVQPPAEAVTQTEVPDSVPAGSASRSAQGAASAHASATKSTEAPTVGTWFDGLGSPYGGCGVPQDLLESQYFVALNVYDTPGEYAKSAPRPLTGGDLATMGAFANGLNCGRWVEVTLGQYCQGTNDGAPNQAFCRGEGAKWIDDDYSGGVLDMLVADSCGDGNAWCRDSRNHLDLSKISLSHFTKSGQVLAGLEPAHWNNRGLAWKYIPAPGYAGDLKIFFLKGTMKYWPAIMINNLPNGIHAVEQLVGGVWKRAERYSDMGQGFILSPADSFRIRVYDVEDKLIQGGREYLFPPPASCGATCDAAATPAVYQAFVPDGSGLAAAPSARPAMNPAAAMVSLHTVSLASGLSLEFKPPFSGRWKITALDISGRVAAAGEAVSGADGLCRLPLRGPLPSGRYGVIVQSGSTRLRAGAFAVP